MTPNCHRTETGYHLREHHYDCRDIACSGCVECTHDEHGNPVHHCGLRHACTAHLRPGEYACSGCLGRIRRNLGGILTAVATMPAEAEHAGVDSEAAHHAGPSAHLILLNWRKINADRGGEDVEDHDQADAYTMLAMRERMIREDLGHDQHTLVSPTLAGVVGYLDWVLTDLARDEAQTLVLADLLGESARLRSHLEAVLHDSRTPERGAPCSLCEEPQPRLMRKWAHWCDDPDCTREHDVSGAKDTWQCPRDSAHWWSEADYRLWVSGDYLANADRLTAVQIEEAHGVPAGSTRGWASLGKVTKRGTDHRGRQLYDVADTLRVRDRRAS